MPCYLNSNGLGNINSNLHFLAVSDFPKKLFSGPWTFPRLGLFFQNQKCPRIGTEVTEGIWKYLSPIITPFGPFPDHFQAKSEKWLKNSIKNPLLNISLLNPYWPKFVGPIHLLGPRARPYWAHLGIQSMKLSFLIHLFVRLCHF